MGLLQNETCRRRVTSSGPGIGVVLGLAALLAGCGGAQSTAAPGPSASVTASAATTAPATTATTAGSATAATASTTAGGQAGGAHCTSGQLRFAAVGSTGAAGTINVAMRVTNVGDSACWTYGYVGLQLVDAAGRSLPTQTLRGAQAARYQRPPSISGLTPQRVTLAPGQWGWFDLTYSDVASAPCPTGPGTAIAVDVIAPDTTQPQRVALRTMVCGGEIAVTPVLPASTWVDMPAL